MAIYYARKAGNIDATDVWATTPSGTAAAVTFAEGDVLMANSFTITVNVSTNLGATGEVRTNNAHGATNGGTFRLNNGVTLTANVFSGGGNGISTFNQTSATLVGNVTAGSTNALVKGCDHNSTGTLTIFGNVTSGSGDTNDGAFNRSTGTLTIQGNVTAVGNNSSGAVNNVGGILNITGNVQGGGLGARGAFNSAAGQINISGNVTGGNNASNAFGVQNNSTGTIVITGNVTGGTNSAAAGASNVSTGVITIIGLCNGSGAAVGCRNNVGGTITITGATTGGTNSTAYGVLNVGTGIVTINGSAIGGTAAHGARNESTGIIRLTRAVANAFGFGSTGLTAAVGVQNVGLGEVELEQIEYGTLGQSPTAGVIKLKSLSTNAAVFNFTNTASPKTLGEAPAISDVRQGTTYALGTLTGTCAVPAAGSVALGVPVDAGFGTAVLTPAAVWEYTTREITGGVVDTLTNAPTVPSASAIADEVRVELATELARIDAPISGAGNAPSATDVATAVRSELATELAHLDADISTRATPADIPATDITAIKTTTDALNTDRLAQVSTVATTGSQLAAALS